MSEIIVNKIGKIAIILFLFYLIFNSSCFAQEYQVCVTPVFTKQEEIRDMSIKGNYLYLLDEEFKIYDISNPYEPILLGSEENVNGWRTIGFEVVDKYVYLYFNGYNRKKSFSFQQSFQRQALATINDIVFKKIFFLLFFKWLQFSGPRF